MISRSNDMPLFAASSQFAPRGGNAANSGRSGNSSPRNYAASIIGDNSVVLGTFGAFLGTPSNTDSKPGILGGW